MAYDISPKEARNRILHWLEMFPAMSLSMLNISMVSTKSECWKPVLDSMVEKGEIAIKTIYRTDTQGRNRTYNVYYNPQRFDYPKYVEGIEHHRVEVDLSGVDEAQEGEHGDVEEVIQEADNQSNFE